MLVTLKHSYLKSTNVRIYKCFQNQEKVKKDISHLFFISYIYTDQNSGICKRHHAFILIDQICFLSFFLFSGLQVRLRGDSQWPFLWFQAPRQILRYRGAWSYHLSVQQHAHWVSLRQHCLKKRLQGTLLLRYGKVPL